MTAATQDTQTDYWHDQADEPRICVDARIDPHVHEAYWQSVYWGESYYRREYDFEDYAPAYCVGYIGYAQYGGCFDDAEKSLCANWFRIKGGSRLSVEEALQAIRAAWAHAEQAERGAATATREEAEDEAELLELAGSVIASRRAPAGRRAMATA
ncbi:hypothetical protein FN976_04370 [Caenimonas sedimenti]|uniref:Uncharacterized protein n=1 Tax=Caenimonas sedimenti TaxID=2596921 RepID=A0A562ZWC4_9BURK|nr:hypothetical protein [Caenimonas sedimenti]TWO72773.1 hypothetical protein FN976_04370 [Caenimonas sedimenti]